MMFPNALILNASNVFLTADKKLALLQKHKSFTKHIFVTKQQLQTRKDMVLTAIFLDEPWLTGSCLNFLLHLFLDYASLCKPGFVQILESLQFKSHIFQAWKVIEMRIAGATNFLMISVNDY